MEIIHEVAIIVLNWNRREETLECLESLRQAWFGGARALVVDNGSRDGSAQLLAESGRGGVCTLLANHGNRHHGPGLNQGISYLAARPGPRRSGSGPGLRRRRRAVGRPVGGRRRGAGGLRGAGRRSTTSGTATGGSGCTRC